MKLSVWEISWRHLYWNQRRTLRLSICHCHYIISMMHVETYLKVLKNMNNIKQLLVISSAYSLFCLPDVYRCSCHCFDKSLNTMNNHVKYILMIGNKVVGWGEWMLSQWNSRLTYDQVVSLWSLEEYTLSTNQNKLTEEAAWSTAVNWGYVCIYTQYYANVSISSYYNCFETYRNLLC